MPRRKRPSRHRATWTGDEDKRLTFYWGHQSLTWIAKKLNRTEYAVAGRVKTLGLGPAGRSNFSMRQLIEYLGVSESRIRKAAKACDIRISKGKRSEPKQKRQIHQYSISVDNADIIEEYLKAHPERLYSDQGTRTTKGKWGVGKKPDQCVTCDTTNYPHFAKGECTSCYQKKYKARKFYSRWMMAEDIDALLEFAEGPWVREEFEEILNLESRNCRIARGHPGDIRGYVIWDTHYAGAHILSVAVHPDHRRRRVAYTLIEDIIIRVGRTISLEVRADNRAAIRLYQKLGFERQGKYLKFYDDGVDAWVMARKGVG